MDGFTCRGDKLSGKLSPIKGKLLLKEILHVFTICAIGCSIAGFVAIKFWVYRKICGNKHCICRAAPLYLQSLQKENNNINNINTKIYLHWPSSKFWQKRALLQKNSCPCKVLIYNSFTLLMYITWINSEQLPLEWKIRSLLITYTHLISPTITRQSCDYTVTLRLKDRRVRPVSRSKQAGGAPGNWQDWRP